MNITKQPYNFDLRAAFPNACEAFGWAGGVAYTADQDGIAYVILGEGTMADFITAEDRDLLDGLVKVIAFDDMAERDAFVRRRRLGLKNLTMAERIHRIYAGHETKLQDHMLPFIGSAFHSSGVTHVRVVAIGINAYVDEKDWEQQRPEWFAAWFAEQEHRFDTCVLRETTKLVDGLLTEGNLLTGRAFDWRASMYVTDAIKVYVRTTDGKRAEQVAHRFVDHHDQWVDEFDALVADWVAPDVVAVFGEHFWSDICRTFQRGGALSNHVAKYEHAIGEALHFVNRITLNNGHVMLLVRLRHPAARTKNGSAPWLLDQPEFQRLAAK